MLTTAEIERDLFDLPEQFKICMKSKDYPKAKHIYDTAVTVALFVRMDQEQQVKLFGSRQQDPPVEGMFRETDVQKAYFEVSVRRQQDAERIQAEEVARRQRLRSLRCK